MTQEEKQTLNKAYKALEHLYQILYGMEDRFDRIEKDQQEIKRLVSEQLEQRKRAEEIEDKLFRDKNKPK